MRTIQVSNNYYGSKYWLGQLLSHFGYVHYWYQTIIMAPSIGWDNYYPTLGVYSRGIKQLWLQVLAGTVTVPHFWCAHCRFQMIVMAPSIGWDSYCPTLSVCTLQVSNDCYGSKYWLGQLLSHTLGVYTAGFK